VQAKDVMTRDVVTVGPDTPAKDAGRLMSERGFAALPVVDGAHRLIGMVAEADVLRDRIPQDPRLHLRRDDRAGDVLLPLLVEGVMTTAVHVVGPFDDIADLALLLVEGHIRSVPVVDGDVVVGIVSRRDVLSVLSRADEDVRSDVLRLVEGYTGDLGCWDVRVTEGVTTVRRTAGAPESSRAVEDFALRQLVTTVPGVVSVHVLPGIPPANAEA
jgi:CBS domain-containing protein